MVYKAYEAFHAAFEENKARDDLNPIEEAKHYRECQKRGMSTMDMAGKYGGVHSEYTQKIKLLELPSQVVTRVTTGEISEFHARLISQLVDSGCLTKKFETLFGPNEEWTENQKEQFDKELKARQGFQINLARKIVDFGLTTRQTESLYILKFIRGAPPDRM